MIRDPYIKIVKVMVLGEGVQTLRKGQQDHIMKKNYLKNVLLYSHINLRQTECLIMMSMKPFTKTVNGPYVRSSKPLGRANIGTY